MPKLAEILTHQRCVADWWQHLLGHTCWQDYCWGQQAWHCWKFVGLNDILVSKYVQVDVAINLQCVSNVLKSQKVWAFFLASDSSTHQSVLYFDIWFCLCANGQLYNLHLMVVPFYDCHTSLNIAAMIQCILDALLPNWQCKNIAFSTGGENTRTGRHSGVVTQIDKEANFNLMQIWCSPHQVDLLVKEASHFQLKIWLVA